MAAQLPDQHLPPLEVKRLASEAMSARRFPPVVQYPEAEQGGGLLSALFTWPVVVWVPECLQTSRKPVCPMPGCSCSPRLKEYKQRVVEEVDTKCVLIYVKYTCQGSARSCFSTITSEYLQRDALLLMHFPYVLTKKFGISKPLMEQVHEGMLSPHGLSSTVENIKRRREKRYYKLLCLFAAEVRQRQIASASYLAPSPPSAAKYSASQCPLGAETLSAAWLETSRFYSSLCELLMQNAKVEKALRMDHSVKFCKRLKIWTGGTGKRESMKDGHMLLLLQNEIGQIVGRRLTRSENNAETRELLEHVKSLFHLGEDTSSRYIVSDNANNVRTMVNDVFEGGVGVQQDPFHVVQRFTEKIRDRGVKKRFSQQLHEAIYDVDGEVRVPAEMASRLEAAADSVSTKDLNCSESEWRGTLQNNLEQIQLGDLYVERNNYEEGGGKSVRVLSTSQVEGFHSALKKLLARSVSAEVGLRILDVFIVRHNLKVGAKYGRNPPLQHADAITLAQTAMLCRGALPESQELEFVSQLMSKPLPRPQYRSSTEHDFNFEQWGQLFDGVHVDTAALDLNLHRSQNHRSSIKELLTRQVVFTNSRRLPASTFFNSLCLTELDYEAAAGFASEELSLLRQLRSEQARSGKTWEKCDLVTTIMYNIVVSSNANSQLKLRRRSYATLAAKIDSLTKHDADTSNNRSSTQATRIFQLAPQEPPSEELTGHEKGFLDDLFTALRNVSTVKKVRQVFVNVYSFASCVCTGIHARETSLLLAKWENLRRGSNRGSSLKIRLKVTQATLLAVQNQRLDPHPSSIDTSVLESDTPQCPNDRPNDPEPPHVQLDDPDMSCSGVPISPPNSNSSSPAVSSQSQPQLRDSDPDVCNSANASPVIDDQDSQITAADAHEGRIPGSTVMFIAQEHIEKLRKLQVELPNRNGKWNFIYDEYAKLYPDPGSRINLNALRCRLRPPTAPRKMPAELEHPPMQNAPPASRKRKETSCQSCRKRKQRCGEGSVNPYCTRLNTTVPTQQQSLDQFYSL